MGGLQKNGTFGVPSSRLIQFDRAFRTAVCGIERSDSIPVLDYFFDAVLPILQCPTRVTDAVCAQGEFVRAIGVDALGF